jgi:hypothetical protein
MRGALPALLIIAGLAGCTGITSRMSGTVPRTGSLVPATTLQLTPSLGIPLEKLVFWGAYAGAAYLILDPLAPNWEIEEAPLPDNYVHFALKMKRYYAGGAGEARVVFNRRAKDLVQYGGFDAYEVLEYSEGIESSMLGSQRVCEGVIRLRHKDAPDQGKAAPARITPESAAKPLS